MIAEQDDLSEIAALHQILEEPVEELHGHHGALVHGHDLCFGELPGTAVVLVAGLEELVACKDLIDHDQKYDEETNWTHGCGFRTRSSNS